MSTELAKETNFGAAFRELVSKEQNAELRAMRERAYDAFVSDGFPTPRDEDWKYTSVGAEVSGQWTVDSGATPGSDVRVEQLSRFNFERNGFASLNLAFADVRAVRIPRET